MASTIRQAKITPYATFLPNERVASAEVYQGAFERHHRRIYTLAFWMTDNEMTAEGLMRNVFCRAFAQGADPSAEVIDQALMTELRELMPLGGLTLDEGTCVEATAIRRSVLRVHLERAVMQLPATERLIFLLHDAESYDHARIARMLGLCEDESRYGLHQARLRIRGLLSEMIR